MLQRSSGELQGNDLFLLATVFYIQTNERAGRKIMRDGVREREKGVGGREKKKSSCHEGERERNCEGGLAFSQERPLKN